VILLDTNVVSALMRRDPDPAVVAWLDDQAAESVWTTSITVFEVQTGLELLRPGRRRRELEHAFEELLADDLAGRVQPFDDTAALVAGGIAASQQRAGRSLEVRDIQIAGIAGARKATLATRSLRHFQGLTIALVDPWSGPGSSRAPKTSTSRRPSS
jgi:predicted nucleic acid-binding protein